MTHHDTSVRSFAVVHNLPGSVRLDAHGLDHLGPLLNRFDNKCGELGLCTYKWNVNADLRGFDMATNARRGGRFTSRPQFAQITGASAAMAMAY
jgi:hypothetical protein